VQLRCEAPFFPLQQIIQLLKQPKKLFGILLVLDQSAEPSHFLEFFPVHWNLPRPEERSEHCFTDASETSAKVRQMLIRRSKSTVKTDRYQMSREKPQLQQKAMRHSSSVITGQYGDADRDLLQQAVDKVSVLALTSVDGR